MPCVGDDVPHVVQPANQAFQIVEGCPWRQICAGRERRCGGWVLVGVGGGKVGAGLVGELLWPCPWLQADPMLWQCHCQGSHLFLLGGCCRVRHPMGELVGMESGHQVKGFASRLLLKSKTTSDARQNLVGIGEEPKGKRRTATAMFLTTAMHAAAILPRVWRRLYAFLISHLCIKVQVDG
eukprot:15327360-Ditylum_brightwellii.AAC.1